MASVKLINLVKKFNKQTVVDNLNLDIKDGEFLVFVGPSGCGKTTTLRLIAGLEEATDGIIEIAGKSVQKVPIKDRDIAMVFQNYALYPHMSVFENIAFSLRLKGHLSKKEISEKVKETAKILDLTAYLHRKPKELSGGQRQRTAMGRALVRNPQICLLDEPLSNLDAKLRTKMRLEIKKLHSQVKATMIYVTHDQIEAMTLGDRIALFQNGRIEQVGTPSEVYQNPKNTFVASFIGSPPMNIIDLKELDANTLILPEKNSPSHQILLNQIKEGHLLGIRPEHLSINGNKDTELSLIGKFSIAENHGSDTIIHVNIEKFEVAIKLTADNKFDPKMYKNGHICLYADFKNIKLFDKNTKEILPINFF
ncbi:MAG: ABC transporter ATP-binding protein [Bdellovibrionota bacterium]